MGCANSKPENSAGSLKNPVLRCSSPRHGLHEAPQLACCSLPLAEAALAGVPRPPATHSTSSSSTSLSSDGGYSEPDGQHDSDSDLDAGQGLLSRGSSGGLDGAEAAGLLSPPVPGQHLPLDSVKTTYKLRVGVLEGTTFLNQYIVVSTLGRGSFGKVKLCLNTGDDRLYAVKVVNTRALRAGAKSRLQSRALPARSKRHHPASAGMVSSVTYGDAAAAAAAAAGATATTTSATTTASLAGGSPTSPTSNLRREVEVMRSLSHPNLVRLYEVIKDDEGGKVLMVMEYCEAGALVGPAALTRDRHLPEPMAQFYFKQMVAGLAYLHQHHVVHGDLKPENVMLSGTGTVKIGDFGQSQFFGRRDILNRTLGTPAYLAPEVCAGERYQGRQADVWALGVSLYLFIYGELPFKGGSLLELYDAVATRDVPYPHHRPISPELQDLFLRLLQKDPCYRITAAEVLQHRWVGGSVWQSLLPDLSCPPEAGSSEAGGKQKQGGEMEPGTSQSPLGSCNADEVAAVVFPKVQAEVSPAGGSPYSGCSGGSNRMQLVDALAAAASLEDDSMLPRLPHTPHSRLHKLSQDSMIREAWGLHNTGSSTLLGHVQDSHVSSAAEEASRAQTSSQPHSMADPLPRAEQQVVAAAAAAAAKAEVEEALDPASLGSHGLALSPLRLAKPAATGKGARAAATTLRSGAGVRDEPAPRLSSEGEKEEGREEVVDSSAAGVVLDHIVASMEGMQPPLLEAQQQQQQHPDGPQQPGAVKGGSSPHHGQSPPDDDRPGSGPAALPSHTVLRLSASSAGSLGEDPPRWRSPHHTHSLSRSSPAGGGGSVSASRTLKARSLGTLRSMFAGPADFMAGSLFQQPQQQQQQQQQRELVETPVVASPPAPRRRSVASSLFVGPGEVVEEVGEIIAARVPPRPPPPRPSSQHPIVVNIFKPGERLGMAASNQPQATCYYIEQGVVELRYEADVPITLSSILAAARLGTLFRRPASAPPAVGGRGMGIDETDLPLHGSRESSLGRPGSIGSSKAAAEAAAAARGMESSSSLAAVVRQATLRAEALLSNAKAGSVDHLLVSERTTSEFLGGLALLDPRLFVGRWKATAVARTHVVVLHMARGGLELFLQHNPLAQVHLRASMAKARAEVVKLEALEKIAVAHQQQRQLTQKQRARRRRQGAARSGAPYFWGPHHPNAELHADVQARPTTALHMGSSTPEVSEAEGLGVAVAEVAQAAEGHAGGAAMPAGNDAAAAAVADKGAEAVSREDGGSSSDGLTTSGDNGAGMLLAPCGIPSTTLELFSLVSELRSAIYRRAALEAAPGGALSALAQVGGGETTRPAGLVGGSCGKAS